VVYQETVQVTKYETYIHTHYGRICPIETPEGPNIGLINSLASYAKINEYGFIEAPYRKIDKTDPENPRVTNEVVYMTADEEDNYHVAQANSELDEEGHFVNTNVSGRYREETSEFRKSRIDLMDVSPKMVFSVATSMIPFLENDDANRALMGSNMQRQAVPLMVTEAPIVATGIEHKCAVDSEVCITAKGAGVITKVSATSVSVRYDDGNTADYTLTKFARSNAGTCINQRPIVEVGESVKAGQVLADGPAMRNGEISLGKNALIGFMTWEGYNYEDAVATPSWDPKRSPATSPRCARRCSRTSTTPASSASVPPFATATSWWARSRPRAKRSSPPRRSCCARSSVRRPPT